MTGVMTEQVGILLINLGTPQATTFWPMRRYLKQFLSDKRVVEASGLRWWLVLNGIILNRRPKTSGRAYKKIWNRELDESPLKTITRAQAEEISRRFEDDAHIKVDWAMRYGEPSIAQGIKKLVAGGCQRILYFPLYPQYSAATTATAMDNVFDALKSMRSQPAIRSVPPYYDHPGYIKAIAASIKQRQNQLEKKPQTIIASFHGLPVGFIEKGDPYQGHCEKTVELLRRELGLTNEQLLLTYQSRSGRAVWIGPDTEDCLCDLAQKGTKNVMVVTPGFAADCVETLEEIEIRASKVFLDNGGQNFEFVPCLNDSERSVELLVNLTKQQLLGWQ